VTVTDQNLCTRTANGVVAGSSNPVVTFDSLYTPSCNGDSTGAIFITVTGTAAPFTYQWSNSATSQDVINIPSGAYTVTVTDTANCVVTFDTTITQPTAVSDSINFNNATCGDSTGSATVFAYGGTLGYTYLWSNGAITQTITGLAAPQTYTVTIIDFNGCTRVDSVSILNSAAITIITDSIVAPKCFGQTNGAVYISIQGGTPPPAYQWSNSTSQQDLVNVAPGTYTVTATDAVGCTSSQLFTIPNAPSQLNDTISIVNSLCGANNGQLIAFPFGGSSPYSYVWSNGGLTQTISTLLPGTYTVTITDKNGCIKIDSATVASSGNLTLTTDSVVSPKCFGETGSIYISVSGGTGGNYSYNWSNGVIIDDNININSGTYTVTVTNSSCSATQSFTVNAAPSQLLDSITSTNTACGSNNGTATVHPYGGTASYTFLWSTTATTQTITNLPQGTYVVTVTDFNGCIKRDSVEILNDNAPVLTIFNIDEPLCYGGTGSIALNASGGVLPYSFLWSNGAIDSINTNIPSGVYTCTVTGGNGCSSDITVFLNQPLPISASLQISPENCGNDDGAVTVFPSGGNGPYQYQWSSGETIQTIFNKNHGTYIVTITDFNQCTFIDTVIIPEVQGALIIADSVVNILCHGQSTGAIYVSTTGGLPPLQYQWSNSSILEDLTNVPAGNYSITIADANGCVTSFDTLLTEPSPINKTISTTPSGCGLSNGTATVTGAGGVPPYTYLWFNGLTQTTITGLSAGTYTVTVTDSNNCSVIDFALVSNTGGPVITIDSIISNKCYGDSLGAIFTTVTDGTFPYTLIWSNGKTGDDITNLFAGTYTLTVTDANNCVSIKDTIVKENTQIITSIITTPPNCGSANGTAFLFPTGGIPAYTYLWQLSVSTLPYQTNLPAGVFPVKITDAVGCILDTAAVITSPGAPQITLDSIINVTCNGGDNGAISINVTGGTQPYTYFWQNTFPAQTTQNVTNLTAGTYIVNVTDTNGCVAAIGYTVTEPTPIQISFSPFDPSCGNSNGSILSSVTGGNSGSYTYLWSTGNTFSNIANVPAGSYTLTVTDSKGCKDSAVASLNNINGPEIIVTDSSNITCNGLNNGYINTQIINGTPPFNILWTPTNQNTPNISNLSVGIYTLTVTDALNCIAVRSVEITEPDSINFNASIPVKNGIYNITCRGDNDGEITLFVSGGTPFVSSGFPVYNYFWNPSGATTQSIVGLPAGVYSVDITDSVGCVRNASFTITEPPFVTASAGPSFRICGTDTAQLSAASPTYGTGSWTVLDGSASFADSSQNNTSLSGLAYGDNLLAWIVSDGECRDTAFLVISRDSIVQAFAGTDRDVCDPGLVLTATQPQFGNGMWEVLEGTGTIVSPNLAASPVTGMNYGNNLFTWTITNGNCIDDDTVRIVYNTPDECFDELEMPTGITPNGDDINDFFFVRGLDYDNNNLLILNRWGNVVYEKDNYKNDWSGTNKTGSGLPDGTYYVILKVPSRNATLKGYVDIRR
ncbi:MAG TPA: gliding motility-associated C-terminal domain-containing protein, partial [Bacteroidia bacterium]|nr:gliding motility-associated C-terminal domain-containing protein [Bacteroidia bacterium]